MKKFFLFIGAMMLAVTMQATLVTENVALSDFAQGSASSWNASTGAMSTDGEWHGITKDFGESPLDVSAFCRAKLTLASEPAEGVTVHLYVTDPQGATTGASISHGSTSAILSLQADQVQSIDIKIQQAGSVTISSVEFIGVYGSHTEINLLTEAKSMPGNYAVATDGVACFDKTELASAHEGDVLKVTYEQIANGTAYAFIIGDHSAWQGILDHYEGNSSTVTHYWFTLTNEDIARFAAAESDLYVSGSNIKITGIQLIKYTDELLWSGNKTYDDTWKENIEITNDKLANIKVGDHLCIEVSALTSGGMVQILNNWEPFTPKVEYIFNESHSAPMTIHFVVSQAMINAWSGNTIRVRGANYTVTEVFYRRVAARKESYTLDVTSAGMATLVLPFNVPSLPDGVKAYNLSNDGSEVIEATEVTELKADKPVLIIAEQGPYEFVSELGGNADISGKNTWPVGNYENEAMVGNYTSVFTVPNEAGYPKAYNYILQHGAYGVGFYRVIEYGCTLAPYRAYLSCDYPTPSGSSGAPKLRMVFRPKTPTGISNEGVNELANEGVKKVLRDGQVIIIRNGAEYNVSGQCVK